MERTTQAPDEGVPATAQILSVGATTGMMNMDPVLPVDLLVLQAGAPPRPASVTLVVPMAHLYSIQPGNMLPVRIRPGDPDSVAIDWTAPR